MIARLFRSFFWAVLFSSCVAWAYVGTVRSPARQSILIEDSALGLNPDPIYPGEIRFIPERAFPGRIILHRIYTGRRVVPYVFKAAPGKSEILSLDDSFSVRLDLEMHYQVQTKQLDRLFLELGQDGFKGLEDFVAARVHFLLTRQLDAFYENENDLPDLEEKFREFFNNGSSKTFTAFFKGTGIEFENIFLKRIYVPPRDSFRQALARSDEIIDSRLKQLQAANEELVKASTDVKKEEHYFKKLERMGALLQRYPELRDYLAIDRLSDDVQVMVVPYEKWYGQAQSLTSGGKESDAPAFRLKEPRFQRALPALPALPGGSGFRDLTPP